MSVLHPRHERLLRIVNDLFFRSNVGYLIVGKLYPRLGLKRSDVILATFPKSGTTWFRFIIANIVSLLHLDGQIVDYHLLNGELRGAFDSFVFPTLWPDNFPRFLASHKNYSTRKFGKNRCVYLFRNPRDVMVSFFEYKRNFREAGRYVNDFKTFIRDEKYGIPAWCKHYLSWKRKADIVLTYEGLKSSGFYELNRVLEHLELKEKVSDDLLKEAIKRSSFERIRGLEEERGLDTMAAKDLESGFKFARKGKIGEWKRYFDSEDISFALNMIRKVGEEDLVEAFQNPEL